MALFDLIYLGLHNYTVVCVSINIITAVIINIHTIYVLGKQ